MSLEQALEHVRVGPPAREPLDRLARDRPEVLVGLLAARDADQLEALGQRPLVREVVERRQQLAVREVAGAAEDHEDGRMDRQPLETLDERVLLETAGSSTLPCVISRRASRVIRSVSARTAAAGSPSSLTRSAGRPCARSVCRSPAACAAISVPNE